MAKRKKTKKDAYKNAMSRKTGKSVKRLESEQRAAEKFDALRVARAEYKEAGDPNSCGDAVALALKVFLHKVEGKSRPVLDMDAFLKCVASNGIEVKGAKWGEDRAPGWWGRVRMTGSLLLRRKIASGESVKIGTKTIKHKKG